MARYKKKTDNLEEIEVPKVPVSDGVCKECEGSGKIDDKDCVNCDATGVV